MAAQKRREEAEQELASRNTKAVQQFYEPDGSQQNPDLIDDSQLLPDSILTAFGKPLLPPPSYEEVVRDSTEQLL